MLRYLLQSPSQQEQMMQQSPQQLGAYWDFMKGFASSVVTFVSDSTVKRITEMAFWRANKKDMAPFQDIHLEESVKNLHQNKNKGKDDVEADQEREKVYLI